MSKPEKSESLNELGVLSNEWLDDFIKETVEMTKRNKDDLISDEELNKHVEEILENNKGKLESQTN